MAIQTFLPSWLKPIRTMQVSGDFGVSVAKYKSGKVITRTLYDQNLATYDLTFYLDETDDSYQMSMNFLRWACGRLNPFWFTDPHPQYGISRIIGVGDGSKTTFVVPITTTDTITILVNNVPEAALTIHDDGPNLIDDTASVADSTNLAGGGTGTGAISSQEGVKSVSPFDYTNVTGISSASLTYFARQTLFTFSAGDNLTAVSYQLAKSSYSLKNAAYIEPLSIAPSSLGVYTGEVDMDTDGELTMASVSMTCPANTYFVMVGGGHASTNVGFSYLTGLALNRGDLTDWWRHDVELPVVEFDTAPAAGSVIKAAADSGTVAIKGQAVSLKRSVDPAGGKTYTMKMEEVAI